MDRKLLHESIARGTALSFTHSGGKGGQNVNKVSTKVRASIPVSRLRGLNQDELSAVLQKLAGKINAAGELSLSVDEERTQEMNRRIALDRLEGWVLQAAAIRRKRKKTAVPRAQKERRLSQKKMRSRIKSMRRMSGTEDT